MKAVFCNKNWPFSRAATRYSVNRRLETLSATQRSANAVDTPETNDSFDVRSDDEASQRLRNATKWRRNEEIKFARRLLPAPVSLTGFGDGSDVVLWRSRLIKALMKMKDENSLKGSDEELLSEKMTPALKLLFDKHPDKLKSEYKKLYDMYVSEKYFETNDVVENPKTELQLPFNFVENIKGTEKDVKRSSPKFNSGLVDQEYDTYLKHHHLLQYLASGLTKVTEDEYESEIEAWRNDLWRRNYGTPNPDIKPSSIPCGGCGAFLHCVDNAIPGYIPSERFTGLSQTELKAELCQRCEYLRHFNVSLNVNVKAEEYPKIISQIKNRNALVILLVDLLDFPCSIWPQILDLIGTERPIYVVGNKVDLLPQMPRSMHNDNVGHLERIEKALWKSVTIAAGKQRLNIKHLSLISAKTGFGIDQLVTKLLDDWNGRGDIILVGCTNAGKSTLFNTLLQSDLCRTREYDLIQRATTSVWPGTTLNMLKFPIKRMEGWELQLRHERLIYYQRVKAAEHQLVSSLRKQIRNPAIAALADRLGMPSRNELPLKVESGHPYSKPHKAPKPFDPNDKAFVNCHFFHDTPGAVYKEQILTLLTTEELLKTIPREVITPRTFALKPYQTLFVGGVGRIDIIHAKDLVLLTVFASHYLPIHVIDTEEARNFYQAYLGTDMLGVPEGNVERLKRWPPLLPIEVDVEGIGDYESCADIVLSSAGWVSVTLGPQREAVLKAYTPEGRGLYVRRPAVLPFAVNLRGKRIPGTPCYESYKTPPDPRDERKYYKSFYRQIS